MRPVWWCVRAGLRAFAQRGTSVEALALLLFGVIVALAMLVVLRTE